MGLTIHYELHSNERSSSRVRELVARLRGRALDLPFEQVDEIVELSGPACDCDRYDREHPHRWLLNQAARHVADPERKGYSYPVCPVEVIAFSTRPGRGCEEANFGLCRYPAYIETAAGLRPGVCRKIRTGLRALQTNWLGPAAGQ
ncbi:MAG: hypothetical protein GXY44_13855 [Phycisphaerales bacterium]|nr:hypothetical protein [Phycisphaerales bacterium]